MLPLPLKWCIIGGSISGAAHLIAISIVKVERTMVSFTFFYAFFFVRIQIQPQREIKKENQYDLYEIIILFYEFAFYYNLSNICF